MIDDLPPSEIPWLEHFFAEPNELNWATLIEGKAPPAVAHQIQQWIGFLSAGTRQAPVILPFMRGGQISAWYATAQGRSGGYELGEEINAWLGPTWLNRFDRLTDDMADPMASILRERFGGMVYRFAGLDEAGNAAVANRIAEYGALLERRPKLTQSPLRPVGAIRSDFERALLAQDESQAEAMIAELKASGRLNEENLRYLDVRLSAGLGLWPQIARDHWLIKTMADLALPPQILADLIEALYRTYVEENEAVGNAALTLEIFGTHVAQPFPKLFASRRGIRAPRVVKAFLLFEQLQSSPDAGMIAGLLDLLPKGAADSLLLSPAPIRTEDASSENITAKNADEAFEDFQFDRAFEFYLRLPTTRKTISRLLSCVLAIGTDEARDRFLTVVDGVERPFLGDLAPSVIAKIAELRATSDAEATAPPPIIDQQGESDLNPWGAWAEQLSENRDLPGAERAAQAAATNWDAAVFRQSAQLSQSFADMIGHLDSDGSAVARSAVPQIFASFFPIDDAPAPALKPIASLLFLLIAMDEALSRSDLDLLSNLTNHLLEMGVSSASYVGLVGDLEDVQKRINSYAYLPWSLDICELLATAPCPSDAARDARLRLFSLVLGQVAGFAHRLGPQDIIPIETLAKDNGIEPSAVDALKRDAVVAEQSAALPNLDGKTIGVYTLAGAAGARAKTALERLFPGCEVVVNSDLVCTAQLTNLAKTADMFVFAWKSSSHQAFYCVKDALAKCELIWAPGKGTASILRSVLESLG